jgi:hypothetical protein
MHCNHPECDCTSATVERNGKSYCSEACATGTARGAGNGRTGCGCGHAGCGATQTISAGSVQRASTSAGGPGDPEGRGTHGDGMVGDTRQRIAEGPGHGDDATRQVDDARRLGFSQEDRAGAPMKPGAAKPRGIEAPGREADADSDVERDRANVRRNAGVRQRTDGWREI